ncbi:MAG: putative 2-dehydropantoate 2-reductase [Aureliella sp.]
MKYAILGTGALGGLYGSLLSRAGSEVHFLARSDFAHIRSHGIDVQSHWGDFHLDSPNAYDNPAAIPDVDVAVVAWKTTSNDALAETLSHVCGPETVVFVLQNGYDVEREAASIVGEDRVLGGCCFLCCNKTGPGKIEHLDYGMIAFGEYSQRLSGQITDRMREIQADFETAGIPMQPSEQLPLVRWKKLMWNIPFNGLSVILDSDTKRLTEHAASRELASELMEDVRSAALACGYEIPSEFAEKMMRDTEKMVPYASSMLLDYRAKRPIEVEAIFGNAVRAAAACGYTAHRIQTLYQQLRFLDAVNRGVQT